MPLSEIEIRRVLDELIEVGPEALDDRVPFEVRDYAALQWIRERHQQLRRAGTRRVERDTGITEELLDAAMRRQRSAMQTLKDSLGDAFPIRLLRESFALRDGTVATYGSATIAQHEERRDFLLQQAARVAAPAARNQQAIDIIDREGVSCLDELSKQFWQSLSA